VAPTHRHTEINIHKNTLTLTVTHTYTQGPTGHFPYPGTAQWALCTPSKLPTPAYTINPPLASSTSLFKWEIMQMSSHHRRTPHISDVHSMKTIVCLWEHVWESAHEWFSSVRDGCGLNTRPRCLKHTSIFLPLITSCSAWYVGFHHHLSFFSCYLKYVLQMYSYTTKNMFAACRQISGLTAEIIKDISLICSSCEWTDGIALTIWCSEKSNWTKLKNVCHIKRNPIEVSELTRNKYYHPK